MGNMENFQLNGYMVADKRFSEIERIKDDKDYRLILYREYHII